MRKTACISSSVASAILLHNILLEEKGGEQDGRGGTYPEGDGARGLLWGLLMQPVSQRRQNAFPVADQTDL